MRKTTLNRKTNETDIAISLNLDGNREITIDTGIGFLDHMLTLFAFHGNFDLTLTCKGDLVTDDHHTVEDIGLALGEAIFDALDRTKGLKRYSAVYLPMDESLVRAVIDISGRSHLSFRAAFTRENLGALATENIKEFFSALAKKAGITIHIDLLHGDNDHHKAEAIFKGFANALKEAIIIQSDDVTSTKGVL